MNKKMVSIALLSLTILSTELFWTRLFSAEFYYTFAFLILSLAVLGLGLGALFLSLFPKLNKPALLPVWLMLTGFMILAAVPAVFALNLDFAKLVSDKMQIVKLILTVKLLGLGFFFGGMALTQLFKFNPKEIPQLYMADFFGASAGVILFILVMNYFGANVTIIYCAAPVLFASFFMAERFIKIIPLAILVLAILFYVRIGGVPEQKREERAKIVYKHWDAVSKIKVYEYDSLYRGINIDNAANSPVYRFDGNWNVPDSMKFQFAIDVNYLIKKFDNCTFLSLGAGGGTDVLQALQYNAAEVHAVEVNPHINTMLTTGYLKDFSGNIYNDKRVKVITEDARVYIRSFKNKFDVMYSLSSNTFAAFASGSFALAENYLFTTEAFIDYWNALSPGGYMMIEHQFYTPRLVAELIDALNKLDVEKPGSHFAVYNLPQLRRKVLLISKTALNRETIENAIGKISPETAKFVNVIYPQHEKKGPDLINSIIKDGWRKVADTAKVDISPCTDDRPFVAQMGLLKNFDLSKLDKGVVYEFTGFPLSKSIMFVILAVCIILIIPLNILPYAVNRSKLPFRQWLYFFSIGMGYMMIEVIIIQQYTLFIGSSIYSIALILTTLLLFSGIGSRRSGNHSSKIVFAAIIIWVLADILIFKNLFYLMDSWPLVPRLIISALFIAPLGYFLGMPFPKLASRFPDLVDWAFAVNGSASVIGSVIIMLIAIAAGYSVALICALFMYVAAFLLYPNRELK